MKGVVMELNRNCAVVLDENGSFKKINIRGKDLEVGQEVQLDRYKTFISANHYKTLGFVAALLIMVLASSFPVYFNNNFTASAYVTIDINPSMELVLNSKGKILDVTALNDEAQEVLKVLNLKNQSLENAIASIAEEAEKMGYVQEDNPEIFVTTVLKNTKAEEKVIEGISNAIHKLENNPNTKAALSVLEGKLEERQEAAKNNISVGKYISLKRLQEKNIEVTLEEIKNKGIGGVLKEAGEKAKEAIIEQDSDDVKGTMRDKVRDKIKENNKNKVNENTDDKPGRGVDKPNPKEKADKDKNKQENGNRDSRENEGSDRPNQNNGKPDSRENKDKSNQENGRPDSKEKEDNSKNNGENNRP